jgi:adenylate cyclase
MTSLFKHSGYTRKFLHRHPVVRHLTVQIIFWVLANIFLVILIHLSTVVFSSALSISYPQRLLPTLILGMIMGFLYGITFGLTDHFFEKMILKSRSLGKIILLKTAVSLIIFILLFAIMRFVLFDLIIVPSMQFDSSLIKNKTWEILFLLFLLYYLVMSMVIGFINEVNKKFGPGVLVPLLMGKYRNPREEDRIFMFMDLKSSTATAEALGHLKYSRLIRDSFMDINRLLSIFNAQVYQYVGDEIVVTWKIEEGLKDLYCIKFFFACEKKFEQKSNYYQVNYGLVPHFKAGLHMGKVTAVEIGEMKRDIAYHGDTLNTASRIQSMCNELKKKFLVSEFLFQQGRLNGRFKAESMGAVLLKGKTTPVGIVSIEYPL